MGAKGIDKGRAAEREVVNMLQEILDYCWGTVKLEAPRLQRRGLGFAGQDIIGLEWLAIEVKFHKQPQVETWWKQCVEQAKRINGGMAEAVLAYKTNHKPWRVRMMGRLGADGRRYAVVDISWDDFGWWFHDKVMKEVDKECDRRAR